MDLLSAEGYETARWLFERGLGALYLVAFLAARNQFPALLGERGLLPDAAFLDRVRFRDAPSLFHWRYSDRLLRAVCWTGVALSLAIVSGVLERGPLLVDLAAWLVVWWLYLSIVNVGQRFYAFGWESMLLEAGFFAAFLGPSWMAPSWIPIAILWWMLFRVEVGAGLIKIRNDPSWRDLSALDYHHETQPLPNPLSWYFHRLPRWTLRGGVVFSHVVQVLLPVGLFLPQPIRGVAGAGIIVHQVLLIVAGNYAWLNWTTVVLGFLALSDAQLARVPFLSDSPAVLAVRPIGFEALLLVLALFAAWLSVNPLRNLFARRQLMNYCWNRWHLVCAYGAFGSMTRERYEVVVEGTTDAHPGPDTAWREYDFRAKPGDLRRVPPQVAPYHLRLDWLMWFLPFDAVTGRGGVWVPRHERWFLAFVDKLLDADEATLKLLRRDPFGGEPPRWIRARYYLYRFTDWNELRSTGRWWKREPVGDYLGPVSATMLRR